MTFLCGPEQRAGVAHSEYAPGAHGWPKPWALRCDGCGHVFEYGAIGPAKGADRHECIPCRTGQSDQLSLLG